MDACWQVTSFVDISVAPTVDTADVSVRWLSVTVVGAAAAAASGCVSTSVSPNTDPESLAVTASTGVLDGATPSDGGATGTWTSPSAWLAPCRYGVNGQPDHRSTPRATNPAVTQTTISTTICRPGDTKTVRPPFSVTAPQKRAAMTACGVGRDPSSACEFDHLTLLEVGGSPGSPHNLFPRQLNGPTGTHIKDNLENKVHQLVCDAPSRHRKHRPRSQATG